MSVIAIIPGLVWFSLSLVLERSLGLTVVGFVVWAGITVYLLISYFLMLTGEIEKEETIIGKCLWMSIAIFWGVTLLGITLVLGGILASDTFGRWLEKHRKKSQLSS
ncbi:MAG: hypothetical protein AAB694_01685 [Patescibacteria group bacterium]